MKSHYSQPRARSKSADLQKKKFENENSYQSFLSAKTCTDALLEEAEARTFVLATTLVPTKEETAKDIFIICVACACMRFSRFGCELESALSEKD